MKTNVITQLFFVIVLCVFSLSFGKDSNPTGKITIYEKPVTGSTTTINKVLKTSNGTPYEMAIISDSKGDIARIDLIFVRDRAALATCMGKCSQSPGHIDEKCAVSCFEDYIGQEIDITNILKKIPMSTLSQVMLLVTGLRYSSNIVQSVNDNLDRIDSLIDEILKYI